MKILESENKEYGFYGTTANNYNENETEKRWNEAFTTLKTMSGKTEEEIRTYLDSRSGRKLADECVNANVKKTIIKNYFEWIEKDLFEDKQITITEKDTTLFGQEVMNSITNKKSIILYTFQHPNRIYKDYANCVDITGKIYNIHIDYLDLIER